MSTLLVLGSSAAAAAVRIAPNDPRIVLANHYAVDAGSDSSHLRLYRPQPATDPYNYGYCAPGAKASIKTTGRFVQINVKYTNLLAVGAPKFPVASVLVNGVEVTTIQPDPSVTYPQMQSAFLTFIGGTENIVTLVWPTAESMDLLEFYVDDDTKVTAPPAPPSAKIIVEGDSTAHGLGCSRAIKTWWYQLAEWLTGYQVVNLAYGGRRVEHGDAEWVDDVSNVSLIWYLCSVNNYFDQDTIADVLSEETQLLQRMRVLRPGAHIRAISPFWNADESPSDIRTIHLQSYRDDGVHAAVTACADGEIQYINGKTLITNDISRFPDRTHPNDTGATEAFGSLRTLV